jgi:hypothetical protein
MMASFTRKKFYRKSEEWNFEKKAISTYKSNGRFQKKKKKKKILTEI